MNDPLHAQAGDDASRAVATSSPPPVAEEEDEERYDPEEPVLIEDVLRQGWRDPDALFNLGAVIVLALVAIATAWAGYQASYYSGLSNQATNMAGSLRTEAFHAESAANDVLIIDMTIFTSWMEAYSEENRPLATFFEERMRSEFLPAFQAWVATDPLHNEDAPTSPFAMGEYALRDQARANNLAEAAEAQLGIAERYNSLSDGYLFVSVLLAVVLFFVTMAQRFETATYRFLVAAMGLVVLLWALIQVARLSLAA